MKFGPFVLLPSELVISEGSSTLADWEMHSHQIFNIQRYAPWWLGDLLVYGQAKFGDDIWQAIPTDVSLEMLERFMNVARKYHPPHLRFMDLSWTHHSIALRVKDEGLRRAVLSKASDKGLDTKAFSRYIDALVN